VGFLDRFDELVVLLRRRLGWPSQKDMAYLKMNHYRHPTAAEWPQPLAQQLNASLPVATDHTFLALVEKQYREQVWVGSLENRGLCGRRQVLSPSEQPGQLLALRSWYLRKFLARRPYWWYVLCAARTGTNAHWRAPNQVASFGTWRLEAEAAALDALLEDLRGHCDPRDLEGRPAREFLPACRHHCEGQQRVQLCFQKR
jgi:hypothetical protein